MKKSTNDDDDDDSSDSTEELDVDTGYDKELGEAALRDLVERTIAGGGNILCNKSHDIPGSRKSSG